MLRNFKKSSNLAKKIMKKILIQSQFSADSIYPKIGIWVPVPQLYLRSLGFPRAKKKKRADAMILPSNPPKMFWLSKQSAQELDGVHISTAFIVHHAFSRKFSKFSRRNSRFCRVFCL